MTYTAYAFLIVREFIYYVVQLEMSVLVYTTSSRFVFLKDSTRFKKSNFGKLRKNRGGNAAQSTRAHFAALSFFFCFAFVYSRRKLGKEDDCSQYIVLPTRTASHLQNPLNGKDAFFNTVERGFTATLVIWLPWYKSSFSNFLVQKRPIIRPSR